MTLRILSPLTWREPSQSAAARVRFYVVARLHDGYTVWRGRFDCRDDVDTFLWALATGSLYQDRGVWELPRPHWRPCMGEHLVYEFVSTTVLTTPTGSNQTGTTDPTWNNADNSIETLGAGASGGNTSAPGQGTGGGGGAENKATNVTLGGTFVWRTGTGGPATLSADANGTDGGDTWCNGTTLAGSSAGSKGGSAGLFGASGASVNGGAGGLGASGVGSSNNNGGRGGNVVTPVGGTTNRTGGGGCAGSTGAGVAGGDITSLATNPNDTAGGAGDAGAGGAGGAAPGGAGDNGLEWGTSGSGGGGGGRAGAGGLYGGGGGGGSGGFGGGAGQGGAIRFRWTPTITFIQSGDDSGALIANARHRRNVPVG